MTMFFIKISLDTTVLLIKKPSVGHRLVTAFADVGRYSKPQPSLLLDVDSTLRTIVSDLTSAFFQIPLVRLETPFRGVRVYTRSAMGIPGSETALAEHICRILCNCLEDGIAAKLADDLYCGADSPEELLINWKRILDALQKCNIKLSPSKTIICPRSTTYHLRLNLDTWMHIRKHPQNCYNVIVSASRYGTGSSVFYRSLQSPRTCFTTVCTHHCTIRKCHRRTTIM